MMLLDRDSTREEVARGTLLLASDAASFATGATRLIEGGMSA